MFVAHVQCRLTCVQPQPIKLRRGVHTIPLPMLERILCEYTLILIMKHSLHHTCHYPTRMCMVMNHTYNTARNYTNRGFVCTSGPFGVCWVLEPRSTTGGQCNMAIYITQRAGCACRSTRHMSYVHIRALHMADDTAMCQKGIKHPPGSWLLPGWAWYALRCVFKKIKKTSPEDLT